MKRNKYPRRSKVAGFIIAAIAAALMAGRIVWNNLSHADSFKVEKVICTGAFKILLKGNCDCFDLKGRNMFSVDLKHLAKSLKLSYPYLTGIRVSRIIPDKIWLDARERFALARVRFGARVFLCDEDAVILPSEDSNGGDLVLIDGVDSRSDKVRIGEAYRSERLRSAITLLKEIRRIPGLVDLPLIRIDVGDPLNINLILKNNLKVIMGNEMFGERLRMLSIVLKNLKPELGTVGYIDLRFPEPAIGKR
jgi:cell division septal protein FtsQ